MQRRTLFGLTLAAALVVLAVVATGGNANDRAKEYVVLYAEGASLESARAAVAAAGGQIVKENTEVGVATVQSANAGFLKDVAKQALSPAPRGTCRSATRRRSSQAEARRRREADGGRARGRRVGQAGKKKRPARRPPNADPLAGLQWDMAMIHATPDGLVQEAAGQQGRPRRDPRHGCRRDAPRHRAELRRGAVAELRHRHPGHRRPVRAPELRRPGERGRRRPRHARRGHRSAPR